MTTILLADDHTIVRQGLRALLETQQGFRIVGETGTGLEAVQLAESLKPEVLILDLVMPDLGGLEVARLVSDSSPSIKVVILSMHSNEAYVLEALRNGAAGYVLKESGFADLMQAVSTVLAGRRYLSPPLSDRAIMAYVAKARATSLGAYDKLTDRERQVLHLAAEGHNNVKIAERLSISPRTVESHRANLFGKLGLRSQSDLLLYAIRRGILPIDAVPGRM